MNVFAKLMSLATVFTVIHIFFSVANPLTTVAVMAILYVLSNTGKN